MDLEQKLPLIKENNVIYYHRGVWTAAMCGLRAKKSTSGVFGSSRCRTPALPRGMSVRLSFVRTGHYCRYVGPHPDERRKTRSGNFPKRVDTTFLESGMLETARMPYTCRALLRGRAIRGDSSRRSKRNRLTFATVFW
jgi:hypothetical protein